jgi:hypothetical protein
MIHDYLLNKVVLKDGRELIGIIDYTTTKQLYFFDFTNEMNIDYVLLSIMWKGNYDHMRFSVFCTIQYPGIRLPNVILIPHNLVSKIKGRLPSYIKPKQKKRIIKAQA